jgi:hypothetical protein
VDLPRAAGVTRHLRAEALLRVRLLRRRVQEAVLRRTGAVDAGCADTANTTHAAAHANADTTYTGRGHVAHAHRRLVPCRHGALLLRLDVAGGLRAHEALLGLLLREPSGVVAILLGLLPLVWLHRCDAQWVQLRGGGESE